MKTQKTIYNLLVFLYILLICFISTTDIASANEAIGTIGQLTPMQHHFLNNETIVRVVPSHIQIVDAKTWDVIDEFGELDYFDEVYFSPNGAICAIQSQSKNTDGYTLKIWDVNSREKISEWEQEKYNSAVAFSPIEPLLAVSTYEKIYLWNWQTGENIGMMKGDRRPSDSCYYVGERWRHCHSPARDLSMVFSPNGRYLIVASMRPDIEYWDIETHQLVGHIEGHSGNWVNGVAISHDGTRLASFDTEADTVYVWDWESKHLIWKVKNGIGSSTQLTFSPDNKHLYIASRTSVIRKSGTNPWEGWDDVVRVRDVESGELIGLINTDFRGLGSFTLSPNGHLLLMNFADGEVQWDTEQNQLKNVRTDFVGHYFFSDLYLSPNGSIAASVTPNYIKTWDVATQQMQLLISPGDYRFDGLAFSPDNQQFAVSMNPWIELRNSRTGKVDIRFSQNITDCEKIVFSPSGRWICAKTVFDRIVIFDTENPDRIQRINVKIEDETPYIYTIVFSDNDEYLVLSGYLRRNNNSTPLVMVSKLQGDTFVSQYTELGKGLGPTTTFAKTKDGTNVLISPQDPIQIWKLMPKNLELLTTLNATGPIQLSPDGRYLLTNQKGSLQIWDWESERPIKHSSHIPIFNVISQDCSVLISYDYGNTYYNKIWDISNLLTLLPYSVEPKDKKLVTLGQIKRNQLLQNYPNPFNPETWIPFRLAEESPVTIDIFNSTGNLIRTLSPGTMKAGDYSSQSGAVHWDGQNDNGEPVSSGIYFYTINAENFSATRKMLIRK